MKFKTLFFLFNIVILISFAFIFFMPLPILGWDHALRFWTENWSIAVLFAAVLIGLDSYFLLNWRLFRLLEREDWPGLRSLLELELEKKGTLGPQKTRIFISACLIGQNPSRINGLREVYVQRKARALPKAALGLGLPLVLEGKAQAIEAFFAPLLDNPRTGSDGPWIRWCVAFGRLLLQDVEGARPLLEAGLEDRKDPVLRLLSLYLLDNLKHSDPRIASRVETERAALAARFTPKEWSAQLEALKERVILVLFMEKLIAEARQWLGASPGAHA